MVKIRRQEEKQGKTDKNREIWVKMGKTGKTLKYGRKQRENGRKQKETGEKNNRGKQKKGHRKKLKRGK